MKQEPIQLPSQPKHSDNLPETKFNVTLDAILDADDNKIDFLNFNRFSNLSRMFRSVAYYRRFIDRCKKLCISVKFLMDQVLKNSVNFIIKKSQHKSCV